MATLTAAELNGVLGRLQGWQVADGMLRRQLTTASFATALELVNRVGALAEAAGHHPDITISYNRVTFALSTHDEGGITEKDADLAARIDALTA